MIHEYDLHHKDSPEYSFYDYLGEKLQERENVLYDVKKEFKGITVTKQSILDKLHVKKGTKSLENVISLACIIKYVTERKRKVHSVNISCKSKDMLSMYKTSQTASYVLRLSQEIGWLKCVDDTYVFNYGKGKFGISKAYIANKHAQDLLMELMKEYNIVPKRPCQVNTAISANEVDQEKVKLLWHRVKISSNVRIKNPCSSKDEFEKILTYILYCKYPQFSQMMKEAEYVNSQPFYREHPELQTRIKPSFKYSPTDILTSIGFRATNRNSLIQRQEYSAKSQTRNSERHILDTYLA